MNELPFNMYSFWTLWIPSTAQEKIGHNFFHFGGKLPAWHHAGGLYKGSTG